MFDRMTRRVGAPAGADKQKRAPQRSMVRCDQTPAVGGEYGAAQLLSSVTASFAAPAGAVGDSAPTRIVRRTGLLARTAPSTDGNHTNGESAGRIRSMRNDTRAVQRLAADKQVVAVVPGRAAAPASSVREAVGRGGGVPVDAGIRETAERHLGQDLSAVRVHAGTSSARRSADAVGARAYTVGDDIVLGRSYDPGSASVQRMVAHELTHVVQQRAGPVDGSDIGGGLAVSDPGDRFEREAEATAEAMMRRRSDQASARGLDQAARAPATTTNRIRRSTARPATTVVQRVGGDKLGMRLPDTPTESSKRLLAVVGQHKERVRQRKVEANQTFMAEVERIRKEGGPGKSDQLQKESIAAQTAYTKILMQAEIEIPVLIGELDAADLIVTKDDNSLEVTAKSGEIAGTLLLAAKAYEQLSAVGEGASIEHATFKRVIPKDLKPKAGMKSDTDIASGEYIKVDGRMLRRYAYRGITPPEREQLEKGEAQIKPLYESDRERAEAQAGLDFKSGLGYKRPKDNSDVAYIKAYKTDVTQVTPAMFAFSQARKGVGKFFSLTSTDKMITSNHDEVFTSNGQIKVDLAQVPESDFVFHYAGRGDSTLQPGFEADQDKAKELTEEVTRARESLVRNREIIIKKYPANAAEWLSKPEVDGKFLEMVEQRAKKDGGDGTAADYVPECVRKTYDEWFVNAKLEAERMGRESGEADARLDQATMTFQQVLDKAMPTLIRKAYLAAYFPARGTADGRRFGREDGASSDSQKRLKPKNALGNQKPKGWLGKVYDTYKKEYDENYAAAYKGGFMEGAGERKRSATGATDNTKVVK
jgi:hypothetical protein